MVGGGSNPMPGEISLAHHGVLFLDELPEYSRSVLDVLREPMETGRITVSRAARQAEFPSRFQLVAAMNPCPCGYYNDAVVRCNCTPDVIMRYQSRVSGPFLDRIDLHVDMQRELHLALKSPSVDDNEGSEAIRLRVVQARERQLGRQQMTNAMLAPLLLHDLAGLDKSASNLLGEASKRLNLSLRAQHRLLRVARTIADLDESPAVACKHLAESLSYRRAPLLNSF